MNGPEVQPIIDSAERAASSGDYALAESLLREVARLQAESLGPKHPDLANTFNNLAVVCERANKLVDAGRFYREALSIASASLNAEDPLVVTSRDNCNEFHRGLGLVDHMTTIPASSELPRQAIVAGIAMGVALISALTISFLRAPAAKLKAEETTIVQKRLSQFGDPLVPATPAVPSQDRDQSRPRSSETIAGRPTAATEVAPARMATSAPQKVHVLEASLCNSLSTSSGRWECTPTPTLAAGDSLYFYTRIASSIGVHIHHRWYRNGTLRQDVGLVVHANPSAGYRTYSQRRVETGHWRIALVGADGEVLREESVEVP
jgi:hypothetical protein